MSNSRRAHRLARTHEFVREAAIANGVCTRPIIQRLVDTQTGAEQWIPINCGSTRDRQCPTCAERNRRLRMQQCREGWHISEDPLPEPSNPDDHLDDEGEEQADDTSSRRVRSTRRRQDVPDLPRLPVEHRSVGQTFTGRDGKEYRPSMFLTITLPSYGPVRTDGTPRDPERYDYRRAALDAMHFPKVIDRLWQNLRRSAGYKLQYFACVEAQKRLAPHLHAAVRGVIPREVFRKVVAATYHQVWWPHFDEPVYTGNHLPVWDEAKEAYVDPDDGVELQPWEQALDAIDDDPEVTPAHVVGLGSQTDYQGLLPGTWETEGRIGYLCKYLTKGIADTYGDDDLTSARQRAHVDRLHAEVRWLPCSPRCANWLRFGIQPEDAGPGLLPGECDHKAHQRENLGCGGRRVLVSRYWTGKTLDRHRADRRAVVEQVLQEAGVEMPEQDRCSATTTNTDGKLRYVWLPVNPAETGLPTYRAVVLAAIAEKRRWREQYETAKARAENPADCHSATGSPEDLAASASGHASATALLRPPRITGRTKVAGLVVQGERSESRSDTEGALDDQHGDLTIQQAGEDEAPTGEPREE